MIYLMWPTLSAFLPRPFNFMIFNSFSYTCGQNMLHRSNVSGSGANNDLIMLIAPQKVINHPEVMSFPGNLKYGAAILTIS